MKEISAELVSRLVIGRKRDGRCTYDPQAKAEVVQACLQPGVSVAKIGLQCGVNANLLRRWVGERQRVGMTRTAVALSSKVCDAPFVPLQLEGLPTNPTAPPKPQTERAFAAVVQLQVRLANGVVLDLTQVETNTLSTIIEQLNGLPCSSSTVR